MASVLWKIEWVQQTNHDEIFQQLQGGRSIVRVIVILVTKETIYNVTGLDPIGERWFVRRIPSLEHEEKEFC